MKQIKAIVMGLACLLAAGTANAQWVVSDPGNLAQGIINTVKQIAQTSTTAKNTLDGFKETAKVFEQGKRYYDALKDVHDVIKGGVKVKKSIELVADISEIYYLLRVCKAAKRECGRIAGFEKRGEYHRNVAIGCGTVGDHRPKL